MAIAPALAPGTDVSAQSIERAAPESNPPSSVIAAHTDTPPTIDGTLDDPCWALAPSFTNFTQVLPVEGAAPSERTEVRVLFDADNLYVAVRCFDSDPSGIIARQMARDADNTGDDLVRIAIDPFADRRNGYQFDLTAAGGKFDGLIEAERRLVHSEWDGIWYAKARIDEQGWTAEFAIPFKTISLKEGATAWGFNIEREIRRRQELVRWSGPRANVPITNLAEAGAIDGLHDLDQGAGLTVRPYISTRVDLESGGLKIKPGIDLFQKLTPSTTAAVTVNTDFAEAEVDQRVVNLTRFPIFFPEKRGFFLQDNTVFSFGGIQESPIPFYSRRIGIVNGEQKDILAGVRVTGRESGVNFGAMDVQMYDDSALGAKNLSVGRVTANIFGESSAGLIFTHGDPGTTGDNTLAGADVNLRRSDVFGDQILEGHLWAMGTSSDAGPPVAGAETGIEGTGGAFGGKVSYPNDRWEWSLFAARYDEKFNPALGFIERPGTYEINGDIRYRWRPNTYIRRIDLMADQNFFLNLDGSMQTLEGGVPGIEIENEDGDTLLAEYQLNRDVLADPFEITPGVTIPTGDYTFNRFRLTFEGSPSRQVSPTLKLRTGDFYDGRRTDYAGQINWRPTSQFFGSIGYEYDGIDLAEGSSVVRIISAQANIVFSPSVSWDNIVQYDNVSENMGFNSRVRWELVPGDEVFVVLNQGYDVQDGHRFHTATSNLTVKVGLTFRF